MAPDGKRLFGTKPTTGKTRDCKGIEARLRLGLTAPWGKLKRKAENKAKQVSSET